MSTSPGISPSVSEPTLTLASPADILAAIPYLVGFHPKDSLLVLGIDDIDLKITTRWDLPLPPGALIPLPPMLAREKVTRIIAVGYGPGQQVTPAIDRLQDLCASNGITLCEALRAHDGRYWSYVCDIPGCCPHNGTPYDPSTSAVAAEAVVRGMVALPGRDTIEATVAPATGPVRLAMRAATAQAVADLRTRLNATKTPDSLAATIVAQGIARVRTALTPGTRLNDTEAARLGLELAVIRVRDEAWTRIDDATQPLHVTLWKDLTRRLEDRFVPPAASLLAMSAWRSGDCVLASIALERALTIDPTYSMANLLTHAMNHLLSPQLLRGRMPTPADLDRTMGTPRAVWLTPLLNILEDPTPH
ncbi:DUF4192 domain-containing protein [Nonomuraea sp. NPDC050556]|uniref:DUF4192 domain-containing protein n=1 Tax=Nonomuraea sp. NPDC050556 TaxID=3364369 RepID=UPI00379A9471